LDLHRRRARFTAILRWRRVVHGRRRPRGPLPNTYTEPPTPLSPLRRFRSWQGPSPFGSVEPASDDVGVNLHHLHEPRCPPLTAPRGESPSNLDGEPLWSSGWTSLFALDTEASSARSLSWFATEAAPLSSDQAPPASFCSATRPASTPASPSPCPSYLSVEQAARWLRRASRSDRRFSCQEPNLR
jgi:hypothetical protein